MLQALTALRKLTAAQRAAIDQKCFQGEYSVPSLLDDLRCVSAFDRQNDATRTKTLVQLVLSIIVTVMSCFVVLATELPKLFLIVPLTLLIAVIVLGVGLRKLTRLDVSNNVREVALPFLAILKQDMLASERLRVRLDLSAPTADTKRVHVSEPYRRGVYHKVIDTTYRDAWFEGAARLADGTLLRWSISDQVRASARTKRNPRGKYKTKTRHYKRSSIAIAVSLPSKAYSVSDAVVAPGHKLSVQDGAKRRTIKLLKKIKTKSLDPIDPRVLIDTIAAAYGCIEPPTGGAA